MKTYDLNVGMVGLRVSCLILGMSVFGTIKEVIEVTSKQLDKSVVILKGLKIELDYPVQYGEDEWTEITSISRVSDEFGDLQNVNLIEDENLQD